MRQKPLAIPLVVAALLALLVGFGVSSSTPMRDVAYLQDGNVVELQPVVKHSLLRWFETSLEAQSGDFRGFQKTFTTQSATGATATSGLMRGIPVSHTAELIVTGGPAGCTYRLQGTRDGTTWFNISAADITCTATTVAFETGKPAVSVRGNLLTLSGGTAPTVTLKYIGR